MDSMITAQYFVKQSQFRHHYTVTLPGDRQLYHVHNSGFTPGKPDLTFHKSTEANGPIAGFVKFRHFSSDAEIGLGDPKQPKVKEILHKEGFFKTAHWFRMTVKGGAQTYTWKRTHSLGRGSEWYKLVEESTQSVVAAFSAGSLVRRNGNIDIYAPLGEQFYQMTLFTGIAMVEKSRRQRSSGAGAAGGGGGGC